MQEEKPQNYFRINELPSEDRRNLVGFFELLLKVDKRVNPASYNLTSKK